MNILKSQRGLTITELMVGLVVGMLVLAAVLSIYLSTIKSSNSTLKSSRLNQEMSAMMSIITNDIRRAGYWGGANFANPVDNPFTQVDSATPTNTTALRVYTTTDNWATTANATDQTYNTTVASRKGSCVLYTYDRDSGDDVDDNEKMGFRYKTTGELEMRLSSSSGANICAGASDGTWNSMNEITEVVVTEFSVDISTTKCINTDEPNDNNDDGDASTDDTAEMDCVAIAPNTGDITLEIVQAVVTLKAELATDDTVKAEMVQTVQVRNNLIRTR